MASGQVGGRVLLAPGVGLEGARVVVTQVDLYDGVGQVRKSIGEATTDASGNFTPVATGLTNGLLLLETQGGTYTDPVNGARIQLDPSVHLRALHWLGVYEDRSGTAWITPVHTFVEARFRYQVTGLHDAWKAADAAYAQTNAEFGGLDWERVIPADLAQAATSPTDAVRASFILGGLSVLADDLRQASNASPQAVGLMTMLGAMRQDMSDGTLDGDDNNDATPGIGLQVGECEPVQNCVRPETGCTLGSCRALCDVYANTYRTLLADAIAKFVGPKKVPTAWNKTGLGAEDARPLIDSIAKNEDKELFNGACVDTQHRAPPTIVWEVAPAEGELRSGFVTIRVRAIDTQGNRAPAVKFDDYDDTDGDPENDVATASINTLAATHGVDGALTLTATATGAAGANATAKRTFVVDNTAPSVTVDASHLYVDANNVWWTDTPAPTISGMVTDMHGVTSVSAKVGSVVATAQITGTAWSVQLPALPAGGTDVTITAADKVGNEATTVQTVRLDTTPPAVVVNPSPVFDEANSRLVAQETPDIAIVHTPQGATIDLATTGSCPTVRKYAHLLFARPVLGSQGVLNSLIVNVQVSDDGVGIKSDSAQYQVMVKNGESSEILVPWSAMPPAGAAYAIPLYRDAIPKLGTTNGEYHIQLRATDQFGRTTVQERCWNHVVLAPPLKATSASGGERAIGFRQALWSVSLDPQSGQTGDFAEKLLNPDANNQPGPAVWRARYRNYLGVPIYVQVQIPRPPEDLRATIKREFMVMHSVTNFRPSQSSAACGGSGVSCGVVSSQAAYVSNFNSAINQAGLRFRASMFVMSGNETHHEFSCQTDYPSSDCTTFSNEESQAYVFTVPPRSAQQGTTLPEYGFMTNLLPVASGLNWALAPSDGNSRDDGTFGEFTFESKTLTGRIKPGTIFTNVCTAEHKGDPEAHPGEDRNKFFCDTRGDGVEYRALSRIDLRFNTELTTVFSLAASPLSSFSPLGDVQIGRLGVPDAILTTSEPVLP